MRKETKNIPEFYKSKGTPIYKDREALPFKYGGYVYANGGNMNQLTEFNEGGLHSQNPFGGIPQGLNSNGQMNLVEEGETKLNSDNYIFSNQTKIDKDTANEFNLPKSYVGKTYAEVSKKLNLPNSRRENDSIEEEDKKRNLTNLMDAQEAFKQKEFENALAIVQSYQPQNPIPTPIDELNVPIGENPQMNLGGYMKYDLGGFMQGTGKVLSTASPFLSAIPGVGTLGSVAAGALGAGLQNVGTNADTEEVVKESVLGGLKNAIPGTGMFANGGSLGDPPVKEKNPFYKEQMKLYSDWNNPNNFIKSEEAKILEGDELESWYKKQISDNPALLEKEGLFVGGFKPNKVYIGPNDTSYPVYNKPSEYLSIPSSPSSDVTTPYVKPTKETATKTIAQKPITVNRTQTYYTQDPSGTWGKPMIRSVPYQQRNEKGLYENLNTPTIVWIDKEGKELTTDPRTQQFADGGPLGIPNIDPSVLAYLQSINQIPNLGELTSTPEYQNNQYYISEQPEDIEDEGARMIQEDDYTIADQPSLPEDMTEEEYQSLLQQEQENLNNNVQDLRVQQSLPNAITQGLPIAYNLGMGLFGKATQLNPDDYLNNTQISAPEYNIDPQLREAEQTYATTQNSLANAAPSSGAYMTNLQQLANMRNKQLGTIHATKENIDNQNQFAADQFNASMQANNNNTRFQVEDYNARAKAAKQGLLSEGLNQAANIAASNTANDLATSYYGLGAPDFKGQVGYTSYFDYLNNKRKTKAE
jgi:hypothetical protein